MGIDKREEIVQLVSQLLKLLSDKEKKIVFDELTKKKEDLPISIFQSNLSGLEAIILYLKDNQKYAIKKIAERLNRQPTTIYTTYHQAKQKLKKKLNCSDWSTTVPLGIFSDRKFSVLESLVFYLKTSQELTLAKISVLLNKSPSTIKTVYRRYLIKNE